MVQQHPANAFFKSFARYLRVRELPPWTGLIAGSPLEGHPFWGSYATVRKNIFTVAGFTDVLRLVLLRKYGGMWVDTDVMLLRVRSWRNGHRQGRVGSASQTRLPCPCFFFHVQGRPGPGLGPWPNSTLCGE